LRKGGNADGGEISGRKASNVKALSGNDWEVQIYQHAFELI